jgi:hypothetical protein
LPASRFLIGFAAADGNQRALGGELHVFHVQRHQLGSSGSEREAEQQHRTVPDVLGPITQTVEHSEQIVAQQGSRLPLGDTDSAPDTSHRGANKLGSGWVVNAHGPMSPADRSQPALHRGDCEVPDALGKVCRNRFRGRWDRSAAGGIVREIGLVAASRCLRE